MGQRVKFMARPFQFPAEVRLKITAKSLLGRPSETAEYPTGVTALKNLVDAYEKIRAMGKSWHSDVFFVDVDGSRVALKASICVHNKISWF